MYDETEEIDSDTAPKKLKSSIPKSDLFKDQEDIDDYDSISQSKNTN